MSKQIINLYEHFKNTDKKLKIVCDWDEVIQTGWPYASYLAMIEAIDDEKQYSTKLENERVNFPAYFNNYWQTGKSKYGFRNPDDFYHQAPFLTIAEDLLKLIKEDKVEELIFLSTSDDRKIEVFKETFGKLPKTKVLVESSVDEVPICSLYLMTDFPQYSTKAGWIRDNAVDFDIFIDDDPENCRGVLDIFAKWCPDCHEKYVLQNKKTSCSHVREERTILAPYYPILANKHYKEVLLVKNEVSNLKKENF